VRLGGVALQLRLPPIRSMADNPDALKTSPAQYLERAKIIRWQTETMSNADVCRQLLDIAGTRRRHRTVAPGVTEKRERAGPKPALPPQSPARGLGPAGNSLTRSPQQTVQTCASGAPKPGPVNPESARQPLPSGSHRPPALRRIPAVDRDKRAARQRRLSGSSRRVIGRLPRRLQMRQPPCPLQDRVSGRPSSGTVASCSFKRELTAVCSVSRGLTPGAREAQQLVSNKGKRS
jgi:hypothetical protein